MTDKHERINYLEFPAKDLRKTKSFFSEIFAWSFQDFGPEYTAFSNAGIEGGFFQSDLTMSADKGSALVVIFSKDLEETQNKIASHDGEIVKAIFSFPGGRRFHFTDPNGNEFAVWSDRTSDGTLIELSQ